MVWLIVVIYHGKIKGEICCVGVSYCFILGYQERVQR